MEHRKIFYLLSIPIANNWGFKDKERMSPEYKSTKKTSLKNKSSRACFWCFTVLDVHTITDDNLWNSYSWKIYIRRNNNKVNPVRIGRIVISNLLPWSDLEKCMYGTLFQLMMMKVLLSLLNLWIEFYLTNDRKLI